MCAADFHKHNKGYLHMKTEQGFEGIKRVTLRLRRKDGF